MTSVRAASHSFDLSGLPLREGDKGEAVLDLQIRLAEVDLPCSDPPGVFGTSTVTAVRAFQTRRHLPADGVCDQATWRALVEAGYALGDRLLYRTSPMQRGDDVAELQRRLSTLGFDPGRIDAIFGAQTAEALEDFQRNAGLPVDGICGAGTVADLLRLHVREGGADLVSPLRERLIVSSTGSRSLVERHVAVGEQGGFSAGVVALTRALRSLGARALPLHDPSPSQQAAAANRAEVDCFVALRIEPERHSCTTAFYSGFRYESVTSRLLAEAIQARLPTVLGLEDGGVCGMALPILRETRMPAVEVQLGSPALVVQHTADLAHVIVEALAQWVESSFD
jgi:N-acetylmuramoyl-L-alanine amidase